MTGFHLKIVTADGLAYDGPAEEVIVRTTTGDMGILVKHINYAAPLGTGKATIMVNGKRRYAICSGGLITVTKENVTLIPSSFHWEETLRS